MALFPQIFRRRHRLVTIGDSLTQGFNNGCIYRTDINYPAMLARALGRGLEFEQPVFTAQGGVPLNLEVLLRGLSDLYGKQVGIRNYPAALHYLYSTTRRIKKYWDGGYVPLNTDRNEPYHNQSVWGFTVSDSWKMTERISRDYIAHHPPPQYSLYELLHGNAMYTTSRRVLNPTFGNQFQDYSMIDNARELAQNGGIENLIVYLGANNIIGAVTRLEIIYSEKDNLGNLPYNRNYSVTRPEHFRLLYRKLADQVSGLKARRVFTATLPYITIPPASRGVNLDFRPTEDGYFDYYTRFWIWDQAFDPELHPYLSREQVMELDRVIDAYNEIIREEGARRGWVVVPLGEQINSLGQRRRPPGYEISYPEAFVTALQRNPKTAYLAKGSHSSTINSDFIRLDDETGQIVSGGIFSLDGLHPTTTGYGLIAQWLHDAMKKAGVRFQQDIDWDFIIENDTLITDPPYLLIELRNVLRFLSLSPKKRWTTLSANIYQQVMHLFSPGLNHNGQTQEPVEAKPAPDLDELNE